MGLEALTLAEELREKAKISPLLHEIKCSRISLEAALVRVDDNVRERYERTNRLFSKDSLDVQR